MQGDRGEPRVLFVLLLAHSVLLQAVIFVLRPAATYRAIELEVPAPLLGLLAASFAVVPLVLAVPSGQAVDRFGERRVMIVGGATLSASAALFILVGHSVVGLVAATMLLGVAHLGSVIGQQSLVANRTPAHRYDSAFGHYTFAASLGQAAGPALIIAFAGTRPIPDTTAIFIGAAVLTVPFLLITLFLRPGTHHAVAREHRDTRGLRDLIHRPGLLNALAVSSVLLAAIDITLAYLPALGAERGIPAGVVGVLLALRAGASMASRLFLGRLSRAVGRRRLLLGTITLSAAGLAGLLLPLPLWALAVLVVVAGLGLGAGQPLTMSWLAESAPPGLRGRAMALRLTGNRLGQVVIPTAAGVIAAGAGAAGVLGLTAAVVAAVGVAARRLQPTNRKDPL